MNSWMDRQPGWRPALIVWGLLCPAAIEIGAGLWVVFVQGSRVPWLTLPETVGYSMIAAMPIAVLIARSARRRGKIIPRAGRSRAGLAWITIGYLLYLTVPALNLSLDQQPYWPHIHRVVGDVTLLLALSGFACFVAGGRFGPQSRRQPTVTQACKKGTADTTMPLLRPGYPPDGSA